MTVAQRGAAKRLVDARVRELYVRAHSRGPQLKTGLPDDTGRFAERLPRWRNASKVNGHRASCGCPACTV